MKFSNQSILFLKKGVFDLKATGVVRRLDELGRLVIPKEIRKRFQMKEGDPIEFYIVDNQIMIQKFEPLSQYLKEIKLMCETLAQMSGNETFFVQEDYLKHYMREVRSEFISKCQSVHRMTMFQDYPIYQENERYSGVICPISDYGEWMGAFVMVSKSGKESDLQLDALKAFTQLLLKKQGG